MFVPAADYSVMRKLGTSDGEQGVFISVRKRGASEYRRDPGSAWSQFGSNGNHFRSETNLQTGFCVKC